MARIYQCHPNSVECLLSRSALWIIIDEVAQVDSAVETDARGDHWLRVTGKGKKLARVALPPLAWDALTQYLAGRELPIAPVRWRPETPVIGSLETDSEAAISSGRLWVCSGASSRSPRRPSRRIIRHWQRSCVARVRTGCATPMRPMHWGAARN
ncbi:hypothetical protein QF002_001764 [Paraburkholderia youngii]